MLALARADLQGMETGEAEDFDAYDIALAKKEIAQLEERQRSWIPEPLHRAQMLGEALKEDWGWEAETEQAISRAVKDLEEGAIYAWDASRKYDLVYEHGTLVCGTMDAHTLEDDFMEKGVEGFWFEEVSICILVGDRNAFVLYSLTPTLSASQPLGRTYRAGKVTVDANQDEQLKVCICISVGSGS